MKYGIQLFSPRLKLPLRLVWFVALSLLLLVACSPSDGGSSDPSEAVERYLQAKVSADEAAMRGLLCSAMEANLSAEASSFAGLNARVEDMECTRSGDTNTVTCTGNVVATYGSEESEFPLASYAVVREDDEWKWCGEAG
jgi:hypothetical protein